MSSEDLSFFREERDTFVTQLQQATRATTTTTESSSTYASLTCSESKLLKVTDSLASFIEAVFVSLNQTIVHERPLYYIAKNFQGLSTMIKDDKSTNQDLLWLEFGVFEGTTLKASYEFLRNQSTTPHQQNVRMVGFDSFEGLPAEWRPGFEQGSFATSYEHVRSKLPSDIALYKGWFQDSIREFLKKQEQLQAATLIHMDGDLFVSASLTFSLLRPLIHPGTILCFDELVGYPGFQQHEILALYAWMHEYQATLCPLAFERAYTRLEQRLGYSEMRYTQQSACFQIVSMGGVQQEAHINAIG